MTKVGRTKLGERSLIVVVHVRAREFQRNSGNHVILTVCVWAVPVKVVIGVFTFQLVTELAGIAVRILASKRDRAKCVQKNNICVRVVPSSMSSSVLCLSAMATLPLITELAGILGGSSVSPAIHD